jgi:hypothetical protein
MPDKQSGGLSGFSLGVDVNKYPLYGQDDDRFLELNKAQLAAVDALRQRYEKPNWFKVAAGFAKPQLGGFTASLGSAAEAMGENEEQRRAAELPIAQMRLELMQQGAILGAHKKANDKFRKWAEAHPGQTPPAALLRELEAEAPGLSLGKAIKDEIATAQANQQNAMQRIQAKQAANIPLTKADKDYLARLEGEAPIVGEPMTGAEGPDQRNPKQPTVNAQQRNAAPSGEPTDELDKFFDDRYGNKQNEPSSDEMYQVRKPALLLNDEQNKSVRPTDEKSGEPRLLPNGARVNDDVYKLHEQGVPVISNIRTPKDQEDLRDPNNPNFTRQGNPVGTNSKHFTGEAIDIDSRRLTDEHRKILKENGWTQPEWAKERDPNHWERTATAKAESQPVEEKPKLYAPSVPLPNIEGAPPTIATARLADYQKNVEAVETPYKEKMQKWSSVMRGSEYNNVRNQFDRATKLMEANPKMAREVFAMVRNSGPLLAALADGFAAHAGNITANFSFPVKEWQLAGLSNAQKEFADEMYSHLINIGTAKVKTSGIPLKGAQGEYLNALKGTAHIDQQADVAYKFLLKDRANFMHDKEVYDRVNQEKSRYWDKDNSSTPYADIFNNSSYLKDLEKEHAKILRAYDAARLD